jgi:MobA/MobL family
VATYFFRTTSLSRAQDRSAPSAAAYRAGERLKDVGRRQSFDYSYRQDVVHKEIVIPAALSNGVPEWAQDRQRLWNAAEAAEKRRDSQVVREYIVQLPHELTAEGRQGLAQRLAREIAERHRVAVDLTVHLPRARGDIRNHHAHLLATTREATPTGLGRKSDFDVNNRERAARGLGAGRAELLALRERWATLANEALKAEGLTVRIDARTLAAQGITRKPQASLPTAIYELERIGVRTAYGDRIARSDKEKLPNGLRQEEAVRDSIHARQAQARDNWLRYRERADARAKAQSVEQRGAVRDGKDESKTHERKPAGHDLTE